MKAVRTLQHASRRASILGCGMVLWMAVACGGNNAIDMQLQIIAPCSGSALDSADHMDLMITSADGQLVGSSSWHAVAGTGELGGLPLITDAVIKVIARRADGASGEGAPVAAMGTGLIDLTGASTGGKVRVSVPVGSIHSFMRTTNTVAEALSAAATQGPNAISTAQCTQQVRQRVHHTATALQDGRVLIAGGEELHAGWSRIHNTTELYNPLTGQFQEGPQITWPMRYHTATALDDGRVLIAGGEGRAMADTTTTPSVWRVATLFDPVTNVLSDPSLTLIEKRAAHTATPIARGLVLLVGGRNDLGALQTTEIVDPRRAVTWAGPSLLLPRFGHAAVAISGTKVIVIGGQSFDAVLDTTEILDLEPYLNGPVGAPLKATSGPRLAVGRTGVAVAQDPRSAGAVLLVSGGYARIQPSDGSLPGTPAQSSNVLDVLVFDPENPAQGRAVCPGLTLLEARGHAAAIATPAGVLVVGGVGANGVIANSSELISVNQLALCDVKTAATAGPMHASRAGAVLTHLIDGDVLVSGGFRFADRQYSTVADSEIYIRKR